MAKPKGSPRCEQCEGRGIIRVPHGYHVCECVRGKPNRALLAKLAAIELPDFTEWDDRTRAERGLSPYEPQEQHD